MLAKGNNSSLINSIVLLFKKEFPDVGPITGSMTTGFFVLTRKFFITLAIS